MENQDTFQAYLEEVLNVAGEQANPNSRLVENVARHFGTLDSFNYAVASSSARSADREERALMGMETEDFIVGPLPKETRLHSPIDLIQVARDFYSSKGLSQSDYRISIPDFEETITFGNPKTGGSVQFDLGRGFRKDDKYELWVTSDFWDLRE